MARGHRSGLIPYGLAFSCGIGAFQLLPELPPLTLLGLAGLGALGLAWRFWPGRLLLALVLGFAWAYLHACWVLCEPLPFGAQGQTLVVRGQIAGLPERGEQGTRFLFRVTEARDGTEPVPFSGLVRVNWYGETPPLAVGETWELGVRLRPPHGSANPGGFDYERWLFQQGIRAMGSVRARAEQRLLDPGFDGYWLGRLRQRLNERLAEILAGHPSLGLVQALVLGERGGIPRETWDSLLRTGTSHLVAISGLNVGIAAGIGFLISRALWRRSARLCRALAAPRAAALSGLVLAAFYSGLAGFSVSAQRALVMLGVGLGAVWFCRQLRPLTALVVALVLVLLVDPLAVLSYGFWLSFGAVALLLYGMVRPGGQAGLWWRWGRAQWVVAIGLLPLLLILFGWTSTVAPVVNLVAVPLSSLIIVPGLLLATGVSLIPGAEWVLQQSASLLGWLMAGLDWVADQSWATVSLPARPAWVWLLAGLGVLLLLAPLGVPGRWVGALTLLPVAFLVPPGPARGELWVTTLDVGQGLSVVLRTEHHLLVYDLGPAVSPSFDAGALVVRPFLAHQGWEQIDLLVLSHADQDHTGGFAGLRSGIGIGRILCGEPGRLTGLEAEPCLAGQAWEWDGVGFEVLSPTAEGLDAGNDSSCVIRVAGPGGSLLLVGDIGRALEQRLIQSLGEGLRSDFLVAAHHGSDSSNSMAFLRAVRPQGVLVSAGFGNRWGFPKEKSLRTYEAVGAHLLNTAETGAISLRLSAAGPAALGLYRAEHRHYWAHAPSDSSR